MLRISPEWEAAIAQPRREARLDGSASRVPVLPWITPSLHPELRSLIERLGSRRRLAAGESIFPANSPVRDLVMVRRGVTGRSAGDPDGQASQAIAISTPGHIAAGNLNFFTQQPAFGRYFALTPCEIVSCPSSLLRQVVTQDLNLMNITVRQFEACALSDRIGFACIALLSVEMRVKMLAYIWAVNYARVLNPGEEDMWLEMPVPLPRNVRCRVASTSSVSMDKILKQWKDSGLWVRDGDWVRLKTTLLNDVFCWLRKSSDPTVQPSASTLEDIFRA
ncbi:MAG: Crp/Fnr family transcriptional regulator [Duodenibacillus sp.]|nr:Crp/Fnr family transcriptional regulator [Duodenibacillus sp.]